MNYSVSISLPPAFHAFPFPTDSHWTRASFVYKYLSLHLELIKSDGRVSWSNRGDTDMWGQTTALAGDTH